MTVLHTYVYIYIYSLDYLLTPRNRALLEKLTGFELVEKFPAFYGTRILIMLTSCFFYRFLKKYVLIKFHESSSSGAERKEEQTDRHNETITGIPRLTSDPDNEFFG